MHLHLHLPLFAIITIILVHLSQFSYADDTQFVTCSKSFQCGNISEISYPFWGQDRPEYCGYPGFYLDCQGQAATITIASQSFRVLQIDKNTKTLAVARWDYLNNTCPMLLYNTSIDFALFRYDPDLQNVTLFYGCPIINSQIPIPGLSSQFNCLVNQTDIVAYYVTRDPSQIPGIGGAAAGNNLGTCNNSVKVPVFRSAAAALEANTTTLAQGLGGGFGLEWIADNSLCDGCLGSGGQCGHKLDSGQFACYCTNGSFVSTCGSAPSPVAPPANKNQLPLTLGLALAGAGVAGVILGIWIFVCLQRRKRKATAQLKTKDLSSIVSTTIPSSNGPPDTENFSRSTPSYPTSKSDLGKGSTYFGVHVFSYAELEEATDNFNPSRELGDGGFGTVYYGKLLDGRVVAVKRLYENSFKRVEQFMNEVEILTRLQHENLVKLYGCTSKRSRELLLVYEYIPNGTVADHLHGNKSNSGLLSWPVRLSIALETADALAYLHRGDIIHRDVKTNNILLDNNFHVKVADFGLSRLFPTDVTHVSTAPQGTPGYVDPEYYQCYQLTDKSDVYSFGVVLMELISSMQAVDTNRHRHDINLANMAVNKIQNHTLQELVDPSLGFETDNAIRRMVTLVAELAFRCLQQERDMRPSMEEALATLRGIQSEEVDSQKAEVVDIRADDVGLLRALPPPDFSPDSVKWASDSTVPHSF